MLKAAELPVLAGIIFGRARMGRRKDPDVVARSANHCLTVASPRGNGHDIADLSGADSLCG
jgi:hypothetical protein